jgi:methylated-DNA-[protein]-cysteine S-methyltransferase
MSASGYALFTTAIGVCGIGWRGEAVVAVQLPERSDAITRSRLHRRFPEAPEADPPPAVQRAIDAIVAHLEGGEADLSGIPIDLTDVPEFDRRVFEAARDIPAGTTTTYGSLAAAIGDPGAARSVGTALGANPIAIIVPCHRVVAAGAAIGGFSASGGVATKQRILRIEGAEMGAAQLGLFDEAAPGR